MKTALRASCPNCKLKVTLSDPATEGDIAYVTCSGCGKKFGLRIPKSAAPQIARAAASPIADDPFASLGATFSPEYTHPANLSLDNYRVRRKPIIAGKPLLIAVGATVVILVLIAAGVLVTRQASEMNLSAVADSLLKGPADTTDKICADWLRYVEEQKMLTVSINRQSDCAELMFPLERLQEKHLNLLIRAALLDAGSSPQFDAKQLPPAVTKPSEGKNFRSNEVYLTAEFRESEAKLNMLSNAVLAYLHSELKPLGKPERDDEKSSFNRIQIRRSLVKALAEAHRGGDESTTAVAIYELTEELKQLRKSTKPFEETIVTTLPPVYQFADFTADQIQAALAERFTKDSEGEIAKALLAFRQAL